MQSHLEPGAVLAGKYRVERVLGQGGMGVVVAATHIQLGQRVAIKFLLADALGHAEAVARFLREARTAVQIQSENVARVSDVGTFDNGAPFIVMEYLEGLDLAEVLRERGPLPIELAVDYLIEALDAIAEAHSLGMVHRDLKPSNLFLARRRGGSDIVKVLDFGISKAVSEGPAANLTATSAVMGSPLYMSPEQIRSAKVVDARSDIWSLGIILHELLAGGPPFAGETMTAVLAMIAADTPPALREKRAGAPKALEDVILRCLEKDREKRFADVAELARALSPFASERVRARVARISQVLGKAASTPPAAAPAKVDEVQRTGGAWANTSDSLKRSRHRGPLYVALGGVVVAGAVIGAVFHRAQSSVEPVLASAGATSPSLPAAPSPSATVPTVAEATPSKASTAEPSAGEAITVTPSSSAVMPTSKVAGPVARPEPRGARTAPPKRARTPAPAAAVPESQAANAAPARAPAPAAAPKPDRGLFDDTK